MPGEAAGAGGCSRKKNGFIRHGTDWPLDRFSTIERAWPDSLVVCIASGPSLTRQQVEKVEGLKCIVVNDGYLLAPWAEILYFADPRWREWHVQRPEYQAFAGVQITIEGSHGWEKLVDVPGIFTMRNMGSHPPLSTTRNGLATGQNSGYQALNIAYLLGASRVILLGYDMKTGAGGRMHWFGDHPLKTNPAMLSAYEQNFGHLAPELKKRGLEVLNCSPDSALRCFPKVPLDEALARFLPGPVAAAVPA